jgi:S1-C subfamily serine protease
VDTTDDRDLLDAYSRAVVDAVDRIMPAVVSLRVQRRRMRMLHGQGSGLIVTPDGYVLTNSHVVQGAGRVVAVLLDGTEADGRVVGDDPASDLALLRVHASALSYANLAVGPTPRPGQLAVAIGNPLGFDATVSTGVVSALGRSLAGPRGQLIEDVLQHTAPLNPGNSGGPLVSSRGQVLGINSAVIGHSQGIGFAIPVETATWVTSELLARGRVRRAYLGVSVQTVALAGRRVPRRDSGSTGRTGIEIAAVGPGTPAHHAGFQPGDVLLALNGTPLPDTRALHRALRHIQVGSRNNVQVARNGAALTRELIASEAPHT